MPLSYHLTALLPIALGLATMDARAQEPAWARDLPKAFRWGGVSGEACWASRVNEHWALGPAHCVGEGSTRLGRDYAWIASPGGDFVGSSRRASRSLSIGAVLWIERGGRWSRAVVEQASGSSYWVALEGDRACPGDSGASVWTIEEGRARWAGMLVSGAGSLGSCFERASVLKAQAIDWGL